MKNPKKLNARGFSHHFVLAAFVLIFAISGVAYLVAGHAQTNKQRQAQVKAKNAKKQVQQKKKPTTLRPDPQPATPQPISDGTADDGTSAGATASGFNGVGPGPKPKPGLDAAIIARSQLGSSDYSKYGGPSNAWCAAFATWTWRSAGVKIPHYQSTSSITAWGKANKRFHTSKPRVGDIMVYGSAHAGIVVSSDGTNIKAIDGNWSGRVSYHQSGSDNGGPIKANWRDFYTSGQRVSGFISP